MFLNINKTKITQLIFLTVSKLIFFLKMFFLNPKTQCEMDLNRLAKMKQIRLVNSHPNS